MHSGKLPETNRAFLQGRRKMPRGKTFWIVLILPAFVLSMQSQSTKASSTPSHLIQIQDPVRIKAGQQAAPPAWAVMERLLMKAIEDAAPVYLKRFSRPGGTIYGRGDVDDVYEMFFNWPLSYAMGADEKLFHWALQEWKAITWQLTYQHPQIHKGLCPHSDGFHI